MLVSVVLITLALLFYSIGVWAERLAGRLKGWHLIFFWLGLACDSSGTGIMMDMAGRMTMAGWFDNFHGLTGLLAILLMIIHAVWATVVLIRQDEQAILNFHRFSVAVWTIWLVPYFSGIFMGMRVGMGS